MKQTNAPCTAIFDMDGTLLDSMPMWRSCPERMLRARGIRPEAGLSAFINRMTVREAAAYLRGRYGLAMTDDEIQAAVLREAMAYYRGEAELKAGVMSFLTALHERNIPLGVATVTDRPCAEAALSRLGVLPLLKALLSSSDTGTGKDTPELFLRTAAALGAAPADTFVFEDSLFAVRTANAAGFCTVGVYDASGESDQPAMRKECDFYLRDMTDFAAFAAQVNLL